MGLVKKAYVTPFCVTIPGSCPCSMWSLSFSSSNLMVGYFRRPAQDEHLFLMPSAIQSFTALEIIYGHCEWQLSHQRPDRLSRQALTELHGEAGAQRNGKKHPRSPSRSVTEAGG